jgi:hypothetical protein
MMNGENLPKKRRPTVRVGREKILDADVVRRQTNRSSSFMSALRRLPPSLRREYLASSRAYRDLRNAVEGMSALLNGDSP